MVSSLMDSTFPLVIYLSSQTLLEFYNIKKFFKLYKLTRKDQNYWKFSVMNSASIFDSSSSFFFFSAENRSVSEVSHNGVLRNDK